MSKLWDLGGQTKRKKERKKDVIVRIYTSVAVVPPLRSPPISVTGRTLEDIFSLR